MPYENGMWVPESDSVAEKMTGLLADNSTYIQQNRAAGQRVAQARGLQNSTMAATAGEDAAIKSALPIATADANITAQKNLSFQGFNQTKGITQMQIDDAQTRQRIDNEASAARQREEIAAADRRQTQQISATQAIADQESQTKLTLQQLSGDIQKSIAGMNISANQQDKAMSAAINAASIYTQNINAIIGNKDIPAATRDAYMTNARANFDRQLGVIEQLYNIDLDWGAGAPVPASGSYGSDAAPSASGGSYGGEAPAASYGGGGIQRLPDGGYIDNAGNRYDSNNVYMGGGYDASTGGPAQGFYGFNGRNPNDPNDTN